MAVISQDELKEIIAGGYSIIDDEGIDLLTQHLPDIAVAALGDDPEPFRKAMEEYINDLAELVNETDFINRKKRDIAFYHLDWLRSLTRSSK